MFRRYITYIFFAVLFAACTSAPEDAVKVNKTPKIYPDYVDVTIPVDIAPMDFCVGSLTETDPCDIYVIAKGTKGGEIIGKGEYTDFDIDEWHELTRQNKGGDIIFTVYAESAPSSSKWIQYKDFRMHVSNYKLDDYGVTYRRIPPGYEVGGNIGIYQRDIHSFDETAILTESAVVGQCFNCHTPNRTDPRQFTAQVRGEGGGTLIQINGKQEWIDTKTDSTKAAGSYAYWHPDGRYVAYAANSVHQSFFTGTKKPIEVYHKFSNIIVYDTRTHELLLDPALETPGSLEIFPAFSADGKTLYYSTSDACDVPREYLKVKCSVCAIDFDAKTGKFGSKVDTLLNGKKDNMSYVQVRPSYDGRWMIYVRCSRSNFPIVQPDADLWIMDMKTHQVREMKEINSRRTESYHNWSSNSRWLVFSSKRDDGMYTKLYFTCIGNDDRGTKPFLLPQRNPRKYYMEMFDAYNVPDFTKTKVEFDSHEAIRKIKDQKRTTVKIR